MRSLVDILIQRLARSVIHQRGKTTIKRHPAFIDRVAVIKMRHNRYCCRLGQMMKHLTKNGQRGMRAAGRAGLQDYRDILGLGSRNIGPHILPAEGNKPSHRIATGQRRLQNIGQGYKAHLNFAIMSLMPGIVSI